MCPLSFELVCDCIYNFYREGSICERLELTNDLSPSTEESSMIRKGQTYQYISNVMISKTTVIYSYGFRRFEKNLVTVTQYCIIT